MNEKELLELIRRKETESVEFKSGLSDINDIVETVSAISNIKGGKIFVGVSNSGKVLGIEIGKDTIERLTNKIVNNTEPKVYPSISVKKIDKKNIIIIDIPRSTDTVLAFGRAFKRVGKSTVKMSKDEYEKLILEKKRVYWDEQICEAGLEDINEEKIRWFLRKAKLERNLDIYPEISLKEALEKLNLIKNKKLTNAAILMFGKNPQRFFLQAETRCARFKGTKPIKPFLDMKVLGGTAYEQIDEAEKFVLSNIKKEAWIESGKIERQEKWEYPPDAIREAITNAVAHRDYSSTANTHISIFNDRIEIWNPGKLPEPLKPEDLKKIHKSIPVNPLLASALFLIKYIERWGTGTNDIIEYCLKHGLPEPIFKEETGGFAAILRKSKIPEELEELKLNERQRAAIEYIKKHGRITNRDYQKLCPNVTRETLRKDLKDLIDKNIIVKRGVKRGVFYEFV